MNVATAFLRSLRRQPARRSDTRDGGARPTGFDAFVSYAREDQAFVDEQLVPALAARAKRAWVDRENLSPGTKFPPRIENAIRQSAAFIFVLSPDSTTSSWCQRELDEASRQRKSIVPIVVREVADARVPRALRDITWIPWHDQPAGEPARQLFDVLDDAIEWREQQAQLAVRAHEWTLHREARGMFGRRLDRPYLLRGEMLAAAEAWLASGSAHGFSPTAEQSEYIARCRRASISAFRLGIASLLVVVAVTSGLAVLAWFQRERAVQNERRAIEQSRIAQSRELAASAASRLRDDPDLALTLAVVAAHTAGTDAADSVLRRALAAVRGSTVKPAVEVGPASSRVVALSPQGSYGVTRDAGGGLSVWQLSPAPHPVLETGTAGRPLFSPDERVFVVDAPVPFIAAWRLPTGRPLRSVNVAGTAEFTAEDQVILEQVNLVGNARLETWDPLTGRRSAVSPDPPKGTILATSPSSLLHATVDHRNVSVWNEFFATATSSGLPTARYTQPGGIVRAWADPRHGRVVITNRSGSAVVSTLGAGLIDQLAARSLRGAAFDADGRMLLLLPQAGPPQLVVVRTGETVAELPPEAAEATAAAFSAGRKSSILIAHGRRIRRYPCSHCAALPTVLRAAEGLIRRPLTQEQRELYLHEERPHPCPFATLSNDRPAPKPCLEVAPNSGPAGTSIELSGAILRGPLPITLSDSRGRIWKLGRIHAPFISTENARRLGKVAVPFGVPLGDAIISTGGVHRTFRVTCRWCYPVASAR